MMNRVLIPIVLLSLALPSLGWCDTAPTTPSPAAAKDSSAAIILPAHMRGAHSPMYAVDVALIERLAKWHCNVLHISFGVDDKRHPQRVAPTLENPLAPYRKNLAKLDAILPTCRKLKIRLIVAAANIYGRKVDDFWSKTDGEQYRSHLNDFWKAFATRYKGEPAIVAYEVLSEPNYKKGNEAVWYKQMLPEAVAAIRSINPDIWLDIQPGPFGLPSGFKTLPVIDDPHVIYSFDFFAPHVYLHQGIGRNRKLRGKLTYPGNLKMFPGSPTKYWDKAALRESMEPAIDFARKHHARVVIGGFGVTRWAPGRAQWASDAIAVFEEAGFDWCYCSLSGWNGWNPTFAPDAKPAALTGKDSDGGYRGGVMQALLKGWALNEREAGAQ